VKFLIDNQLPVALARFLEQKGVASLHVSDIGLEAATDQTVWNHALLNDLVIVSKDMDFVRRAQLGDAKPQVVWVRCGNCSKTYLFSKFNANINALIASVNQGEIITELL
jgi:predicted nuclease of predicted toxin-antitoxin system